MRTELTWIANVSASCFHTARIAARGATIVDPRLASVVPPLAADLVVAIEDLNVDLDAVLDHLTGLAHRFENNRELAEMALTKVIGRDRAKVAAPALVGPITRLETAMLAAVPNMVEELDLRSRPLRELWEARGPGMLARLRQTLGEELVVESADVVVVHPVLGGGGSAHLPYNTVHIEGVLANPMADLPEAIRLLWLLSQLQFDLPRFSELIAPKELPRLAMIATVPASLDAAEHVEFGRFSAEGVTSALRSWKVTSPEEAPSVAATAIAWWEEFRAGEAPFAVALRALPAMLDAAKNP
jgi:hypothetical protein